MDVEYNLILVQENVRPAMLVQPADYKEATGKDPKTKAILDSIRLRYPDIILSEAYENYQGILVSKQSYDGHISLERMGEILGYPCFREFQETPLFSIHVNVHTDHGMAELFANGSTSDSIEAFQAFAEKATPVLQSHFKSFQRIEIAVYPIVPTQTLIDHLLEEKELTSSELDHLQSVLFNFGFSVELQFYVMDHVQFHNPVHRGILLSLLAREKNDTLSPFFPLQQYPAQRAQVDALTQAWEADLMYLFEKSILKFRESI
jgi:hypothetical protein